MHLPPDPEHILECLEIQGQDLYDNPVMVAEEMGIGHIHIMELKIQTAWMSGKVHTAKCCS